VAITFLSIKLVYGVGEALSIDGGNREKIDKEQADKGGRKGQKRIMGKPIIL